MDPGALHSALATVCAHVTPLTASPWQEHLIALGWPARPTLVAQPTNAIEVAAVLETATVAKAAVIPVGSGTHLQWGTPPQRANILLDMTRMDQIVKYAPEDMYVTVQAGCPFRVLQQELAHQGQFIAVDPAISSTSTVGGVVSCDPPGLWRSGLGSLRDCVIGTRVATSDGKLASSGSNVMKNVAGLELPKLYTGALGTLAVLVDVTFKVRFLPESWRLVVIPLHNWAQAEAAIATIVDSQLNPVVLELLNNQAYAVMATTGAPMQKPGPTLFVGFCGNSTDTAWQVHECINVFRKHEESAVAEVPWTIGYPQLQSLLLPPSQFSVSMIAALMSSEVASFCADVENMCTANNATVLISARAGVGQVSLHIRSSSDSTVEKVADLARTLQERAHALPCNTADFREQSRGNAIIVGGNLAVRQLTPSWGAQPTALSLMSAIKNQLDPTNTLNPGRFVGGV